MHPAFSVILLTTLIGTGQGLFLALFTVQSYALVGLLPAVEGRAGHLCQGQGRGQAERGDGGVQAKHRNSSVVVL